MTHVFTDRDKHTAFALTIAGSVLAAVTLVILVANAMDFPHTRIEQWQVWLQVGGGSVLIVLWAQWIGIVLVLVQIEKLPPNWRSRAAIASCFALLSVIGLCVYVYRIDKVYTQWLVNP